MVGHYRSDGRDNDTKGDKYPTNGVNLSRVVRIARLVQVVIETSTFTNLPSTKARMPSTMKSKAERVSCLPQ